MSSIAGNIPRFILPIKYSIVFGGILLLIWGIQSMIHRGVLEETVVWEGSCTPTGWTENNSLGLILDCGEQGSHKAVYSDSVLRSYLNDPGPLSCEISASDKISCEPRLSEDDAVD